MFQTIAEVFASFPILFVGLSLCFAAVLGWMAAVTLGALVPRLDLGGRKVHQDIGVIVEVRTVERHGGFSPARRWLAVVAITNGRHIRYTGEGAPPLRVDSCVRCSFVVGRLTRDYFPPLGLEAPALVAYT